MGKRKTGSSGVLIMFTCSFLMFLFVGTNPGYVKMLEAFPVVRFFILGQFFFMVFATAPAAVIVFLWGGKKCLRATQMLLAWSSICTIVLTLIALYMYTGLHGGERLFFTDLFMTFSGFLPPVASIASYVRLDRMVNPKVKVILTDKHGRAKKVDEIKNKKI